MENAGLTGEAGLFPQQIVVEGRLRYYEVSVPPDLPRDRPAPVLLVYHGTPQKPEGIRRLAAPEEPAAERGMLVVYPQSAVERWATNYDAYPGNLGIDDVRFTRAVLDRIHQDIPIGPVLATGFSNGALFLQRLACDMGDQLDGLGVVGATVSVRTAYYCSFAKPIPTVWFLGDQDGQFPFGGVYDPYFPYFSAVDGADWWAAANGCGSGRVVTILPDLHDDGTLVRRWDYPNCPPEGEFTFFHIVGGGHTWPGSPFTLRPDMFGHTTREIDATRLMLDMLLGPAN